MFSKLMKFKMVIILILNQKLDQRVTIDIPKQPGLRIICVINCNYQVLSRKCTIDVYWMRMYNTIEHHYL